MPGSYGSNTEAMGKKQMAAIIAGVVVAALIIFGGGAYLFTRLFAGATVRTVDMSKTMQLEPGEYSDPLVAQGTIKAASSTSVSPKVDGTVTEVLVKDGSKVAAGDVLFTMENEEFSDALKQADKAYQKSYTAQEKAQAAYDKTVANVKKAKKDLAAAKSAYEEQQAQNAADETAAQAPAFDSAPYDTAIAYAQEAKDNAKESLDNAKSNTEAAKKAYEDAKKKTDSLTVKADVAGTVVDVKAEKGSTTATLASQGPALRIVDLDTLVAVVQVPDSQIGSVRINQTGTVRATGASEGAVYGATVSKIADTPVEQAQDGAESSYEVQLTVDAPVTKIKDGMAITAEIEVTDYGVVYYVPQSALGDNGTNAYVEIVYNDRSTKQSQVTVLGESEDGSTVAIQGEGISKNTTIRTDVATATDEEQ